MSTTGVILAAGAGSRMGMPKALVVRDGEPWVARACALLLAAGCERVVVVLGASASEARALVPTDAAISTIVNDDWASGMGSSLRVGLAAASGDAALVTLVDTPGLPVEVVRRVLEASGRDSRAALARAMYNGRPGHPVLVGADHWAALSETLSGDRGARAYLDAHGVTEVECRDLWHGRDEDTALPPAAG